LTAPGLKHAVGAQAEWMRDLLVELVAAPTELGNEEAGQRIIARAFADCGLEPHDVWLDPDALRAHPNASPFSWEVGGKRNVTATWAAAGRGGRSLTLNGHIDVVPPAAPDLWTRPPYTAAQDGDWVYGRGAGDMKAGLVAIAGAVRALRDAGVELDGDVHLQSVVEEECTGNGTLQCLIDGATADACVLTEPHPDHLTIAQVGVLWFHLDVQGAPAHAARASALGHNAIDAAHTILAELRELERELNAHPPAPYDTFEHPINLNPGIVSGGDWTSTVAARCMLSCRLACYPGEDPYALRAQVEAAVARATARDPFLAANPPRVRYDGFTCEGSTVATDEPLVTALSGAYAQVHGHLPRLEATTATTDARHFIRSGIPAVCFGPHAENIHGIDERVSLRSIADCSEVLARFIVDWCTAEAPHPAVAGTQIDRHEEQP
jgi:acetylornithine deacetylase